MSTVYVRTLEGRVARVSPKGAFIPHHEHVGVKLTPYIARLANHHGDIELLREKPSAAKAPKKTEETPSK
jgi:hypothetical protein